jgi:hypothetical protein
LSLLFYRIFQSFPSLFFELIAFGGAKLNGDPGTDASGYTFKSIQVKQTKLTMDGLFSPPEDRLDGSPLLHRDPVPTGSGSLLSPHRRQH